MHPPIVVDPGPSGCARDDADPRRDGGGAIDRTEDGFAAIAAELFALPLKSFTAERTARAKAARTDGDRDLAARISALQKPSVAAWLVDLLAREGTDDLQGLVDLGAAFREAQAAPDPKRLRELTAQRRSLLAEVADTVARLGEEAGQPASAAVLEDVQQTLQAVIASEEAAAAVASGRLVHAISADGLDPVDLRGAVAGGAPAPVSAAKRASRSASSKRSGGTDDGEDDRQRAEERRREREEAQQRADEAGRRAEEARQDADEAAARAKEAEAAATDRAKAAADLRRQLEDLRDRLDDAEAAARDAEAAAEDARAEADDAAGAADDAERESEEAAERVRALDERGERG